MSRSFKTTMMPKYRSQSTWVRFFLIAYFSVFISHLAIAKESETIIPNVLKEQAINQDRDQSDKNLEYLIDHYLILKEASYNIHPWQIKDDTKFNKSISWSSNRLEFDGWISYRLGKFGGLRFAAIGVLAGPFWLVIKDTNKTFDIDRIFTGLGFIGYTNSDNTIGPYEVFTSNSFKSVIYIAKEKNLLFCFVALNHTPEGCDYKKFQSSFMVINASEN